MQFDMLVELLQSLYDDGTQAARLSGTDASSFDTLGSIVDELSDFRENGLTNFSEQTTFIFGLVTRASMIVGGLLMATAVLGIIGPASLVRVRTLLISNF